MKKIKLIATISLGILLFASCSKDDCVCTTTSSKNGVVITSSSTSTSSDSGLGPLGNSVESEFCDDGDYSYSYTDSQGNALEDKTECELE